MMSTAPHALTIPQAYAKACRLFRAGKLKVAPSATGWDLQRLASEIDTFPAALKLKPVASRMVQDDGVTKEDGPVADAFLDGMIDGSLRIRNGEDIVDPRVFRSHLKQCGGDRYALTRLFFFSKIVVDTHQPGLALVPLYGRPARHIDPQTGEQSDLALAPYFGKSLTIKKSDFECWLSGDALPAVKTRAGTFDDRKEFAAYASEKLETTGFNPSEREAQREFGTPRNLTRQFVRDELDKLDQARNRRAGSKPKRS